MPDILTTAQVVECRERAERATEGPWMAVDSNEGCWPAPPRWEVQSDTWANPHHYPDDELLPEMCLQIEWYGGNTEADAEFIAHAREDVPSLLSDRAELVAEVERLRALYLDMGCHAAGFEYTVRHLEEENARLRTVVGERGPGGAQGDGDRQPGGHREDVLQ